MRLHKVKKVRWCQRVGAMLMFCMVFTAHGFTPLNGPLWPALAESSSHLVLLGGRYYQTKYSRVDWSGTVNAYRVSATGEPGEPLWSTDQTFATAVSSAQRQTWRLAQGATAATAVPLHANSAALLSAAQQAQLRDQAQIAGLPADEVSRLLRWVSGGQEQALRSRRRLLGDILNTAPVLAGGQQPRLAQPQDPGYADYLATREKRMEPVLLLGANDGFFHLFNTAGTHRYAFLPASLQAGIGPRARSDYGGVGHHRPGVDGSISVADIRLDARWSTLAAAGLGAGGQGVFVIRLFDDSQGDGARGALWEVDARRVAQIGHIYGPPLITRLHGRSVLITGNGYGSQGGGAALMIFDLHTGNLLKQLDVTNRAGADRANGLSTPVLQRDATGEVIAAFAGDLQGQLWKFDLRGVSRSQWLVAHNGAPLFTAGTEQPIAMQPLLHPSLQGDRDLVLFSTGKLLEADDLTDTSIQAVYAVLDVAALPTSGLTPQRLLKQQLLKTHADPRSGQAVRTATHAQVDWSHQYGWYLPLIEAGQRRGERVLRNFTIQHGRLLFTSVFLTPGATGLETGSWLMVLNLDHGGMPPTPVLDTTGDRLIDEADLPVTGLQLSIGLPGHLNVLQRVADGAQEDGCDDELYVLQGTTGVATVAGQPECQLRRILWRQLQ